MKNHLNNFFFGFALLMILGAAHSCTIHKRVHRKGWFVQWNVSESGKQKKDRGSHSGISKTSDQHTIHPDSESISESEDNLEIPEAKKLNPVNGPKEDQIEPLKNHKVDKPDEAQDFTPLEESQDGGEKKWHKAAPIVTSILGLSGALLTLLVGGFVPIIIPFVITSLAGAITLIQILKDPEHKKGRSPKEKIISMAVMLFIFWGISLFLNFLFLSSTARAMALVLAGFFALIALYVNQKSEKRNTAVPREETVSDTSKSQRKPPKNYSNPEILLAFGILLLLLAAFTMMLGIIVGILQGLFATFAIPNLFLLVALGFLFLGIILITIYRLQTDANRRYGPSAIKAPKRSGTKTETP